jgi:hypothetical protein
MDVWSPTDGMRMGHDRILRVAAEIIVLVNATERGSPSIVDRVD